MYPCMIFWIPVSFYDEDEEFNSMRFFRGYEEDTSPEEMLDIFASLDEEFVEEHLKTNK